MAPGLRNYRVCADQLNLTELLSRSEVEWTKLEKEIPMSETIILRAGVMPHEEMEAALKAASIDSCEAVDALHAYPALAGVQRLILISPGGVLIPYVGKGFLLR